MDIGYMGAPRNHPDRPYPLHEVYENYIADAIYAEKLGFDHVWVSEHHMTPCQWTPSPLLVLTAVAARTERVRLATDILCLPLHNLLQVAEDAAVLDQISKGRFDFAAGAGSQWEEFYSRGVPIAQRWSRMWEGLSFVEQCFTETGTFSFEGKYYRFPEVTPTTRPYQEKIPIWVGGFGKKSQELAGERGYHLVSERTKVYDDALVASGRDPKDYFSGGNQRMCLADTTEQAWEASIEGLRYHYNFYRLRRRQADGSIPDPSVALSAEQVRALDPVEKQFDDVRTRGTIGPLVGTPDEVLSALERKVKGTGTTHLPIAFRLPGMRTPEVRHSMDLFAREILPEVKRW